MTEVLSDQARQTWEAIVMSTGISEYQSEIIRRLRVEREARGEAMALQEVLTVRGIAIPDEARIRIEDCTEPDQLLTWIRRATHIDTIDELFD